MALTLTQRAPGRRFTVACRPVVSFVSPSYLGLERHPAVADAVARAVRAWGVTTATPRAVLRDPLTRALELGLSRFVGQPAALVFPSARHVACDVLPVMAGRRGILFVDHHAYPTSLDGVREAERLGARVSCFAHNDADALAWQLRHAAGRKVIVVDGVYVAGGDAAPLEAYARVAEQSSALMYMDDSHGLGVLGRRDPDETSPFGLGGGGLLRYAGVSPHRVVVAGTLTKALGAPLAFVAGDRALLKHVEAVSTSFVHSSPPSIPNLAAAYAALTVQAAEGNVLRARLEALVARFRTGVRAAGLELGSNGVFPIQTVPLSDGAEDVIRRLMHAGILPALQHQPPDCPRGSVLRFFVTALHTAADVDRAVDALGAAVPGRPFPRGVIAAGTHVLDPARARFRSEAPWPRAPRAIRRRTSRTAREGAS